MIGWNEKVEEWVAEMVREDIIWQKGFGKQVGIRKGWGIGLSHYRWMGDSAFTRQVVICISRYVIIIIDVVFENMRLISWMFWAFVLVMSRGSPITSPTFVRGAMNDSMLGAVTLEACVLRKRSGALFWRSWGTIYNDQVMSRPIRGWWPSFLGG